MENVKNMIKKTHKIMFLFYYFYHRKKLQLRGHYSAVCITYDDEMLRDLLCLASDL